MRVSYDENHAPITRALERAGCYVIDLARVGGGVPDILVYRRATGLLRLIEIKTAKGRLRKSQEEFAQKCPRWVARTVREAFEAMGIEVAA